jgi:hypothetical protein
MAAASNGLGSNRIGQRGVEISKCNSTGCQNDSSCQSGQEEPDCCVDRSQNPRLLQINPLALKQPVAHGVHAIATHLPGTHSGHQYVWQRSQCHWPCHPPHQVGPGYNRSITNDLHIISGRRADPNMGYIPSKSCCNNVAQPADCPYIPLSQQ